MIENYFNLEQEKLEKLHEFMELVLDKNKVMNLTGITEENEFYDKHFFDSLLPTKILDFNNKTILDIGSGAGFPGIPLAICFPNSSFVLMEPMMKRCTFLNESIKKLGLTNVQVVCKRAEEIGDEREKYDIVLSRAVSQLNILLELSLPYVKTNGMAILYKGLKYEDELEESKNALKLLGGKLDSIQKEKLPLSKETRFNIIIKKIVETDKKFPRNFSQIKKKPL